MAPDDLDRLTRIVREWTVPLRVLGHVGGDRLDLRVGDTARVSLGVDALAEAFDNGLARALEQPVEALTRRAEGPA